MFILFSPFGFIVNLADYVYPVQALWFYCEQERKNRRESKPKSLNRVAKIRKQVNERA
jgi:hypothetical protein